MHVASVRSKIEDRVADDLTRAVIGDVAAAASLVDGDTKVGEPLAAGHDIGARFTSERQA